MLLYAVAGLTGRDFPLETGKKLSSSTNSHFPWKLERSFHLEVILNKFYTSDPTL